MNVGTATGFYTATFASPVTVTGTFYIALDHTGVGSSTFQATLSSGSGGGYYRSTQGSGSWTPSAAIGNARPTGSAAPVVAAFATPSIGNVRCAGAEHVVHDQRRGRCAQLDRSAGPGLLRPELERRQPAGRPSRARPAAACWCRRTATRCSPPPVRARPRSPTTCRMIRYW